MNTKRHGTDFWVLSYHGDVGVCARQGHSCKYDFLHSILLSALEDCGKVRVVELFNPVYALKLVGGVGYSNLYFSSILVKV